MDFNLIRITTLQVPKKIISAKKNTISVKLNQTQDSLLFLDDELTKPGLGYICLRGDALNAGSLKNIFRNVKRCFQISHSGNFS